MRIQTLLVQNQEAPTMQKQRPAAKEIACPTREQKQGIDTRYGAARCRHAVPKRRY